MSLSQTDRPKTPRALRRLRNDVLIAVAIKVLAILALGFIFFGPAQRPHITPQSVFFPSQAAAPANE